MNLIKLYKLTRDRKKNTRSYIAFQEYQASEVVKDLNKYLKVKKDAFVIDWGCGKGGYSHILAKNYSKVVGIDFYVKPYKNKNLEFESHNLLEYISKEKADLIFCASVIEHVKFKKKLVENIYKSLKNGGKLYLSFPPFYSVGGGHQLKPFHFLPEKLAIFIGHRLKRIDKNVNSYDNLFGNWGLYKTHINQIKSLLKSRGFKIIRYKPRYFNLLDTTKLYLIKDLLTWHVEFYCEKK